LRGITFSWPSYSAFINKKKKRRRQQFNPSHSTTFLGITPFIATTLRILMQFPELQDSPCSAVKTFKMCINREFMGEASAKAALTALINCVRALTENNK